MLAMAGPMPGQVIYNANFDAQSLGALTTGSAPSLPQSIIADTGVSVSVVATAGNLTSQPVLFHTISGSLASAAFFNPSPPTSGNWRVSWQSLVLGTPVGDPLTQPNVQIIDPNGTSSWSLKYLPSGQFYIEDAGGFHTVGSFVTGQSDLFDVELHLTTNTYDFLLNNNVLLSGSLAGNGVFDFTYFRINGRTGFALPDLAIDNFTVSAIPEPSTYAALFGLGALGFAAYRRPRERAG